MYLFNRTPWGLWIIGGLCCLGLSAPFLHLIAPQEYPFGSPYLRIDPDKILEASTCQGCHQLAYAVWDTTRHAEQFSRRGERLFESNTAQQILENLDLPGRTTRNVLCLKCHYTATQDDDNIVAVSGVSCESCHGAASDWFPIHHDYGEGFTFETETAEHRQQRIEQSRANGMLRPSDDLYGVTANCFECHVVPHEELVVDGGHPTGGTFDLVQNTDLIRHNFLQVVRATDPDPQNEVNRPQTQDRKRLMYVINQMLEYEYSLRGAAEATEDNHYFGAMLERKAIAFDNLTAIVQTVNLPEVNRVLALDKQVDLQPGQKTALLAVADQVRTYGQEFTRNHDGSGLAALDGLVAGEAPPPPVVIASDATPTTPTSTPTGATDPAGTPADTPPVTASAVELPGRILSRPQWFASTAWDGSISFTTRGCSCHQPQRVNHGHENTTAALATQKAGEIAEIYGIGTANMWRGDQVCMNCHGTPTRSGRLTARNSASCESCHGPADQYRGPHQDGNGAAHGLVDLEDINVQAATCARCHQISDERLLAAGHPDGSGFDLGQRNSAIAHDAEPNEPEGLFAPGWSSPGAAALNGAYTQVTSARPIPQVQTVSLAEVGKTEAEVQTAVVQSARPVSPRASSSPSRVRRTNRDTFRGDLEPLPAVTDSTSTEAILLIIKQRLDELYRALGRGQ